MQWQTDRIPSQPLPAADVTHGAQQSLLFRPLLRTPASHPQLNMKENFVTSFTFQISLRAAEEAQRVGALAIQA